MRMIIRRPTIYEVTIFLAAFLLFGVQPIISKYILPWFGGSPSVWITAMLFFQVLLLGGYLYIRLIAHRPLTQQIIAYLIVLAVALFFLPIEPASSWRPIGDIADPTRYILILLAASVGAPYLTLAAASPLLQAWSDTGNPKDTPYRLYVWSNAGSLAGLLSYPIFIEPLLTVQQQTYVWSGLFLIFTICITILAFVLFRRAPKETPTDPQNSEMQRVPVLSSAILWTLLPFSASLMLLATTNYITQDVASVPLLWIIPLSIYLISFILTFDSERFYDRNFFATLFLLCCFIGTFLVMQNGSLPLPLLLTASMLMLGVICIVCHGELYALRPASRHLSSFYTWMALGGALGGASVALLAPRFFPLYFELHFGIAWTVCLILFLWNRKRLWSPKRFKKVVLVYPILIIVMLSIAAIAAYRAPLFAHRDFFGSLRIFGTDEYAMLYHGRILHGFQFKRDDLQCWPTTYYGYTSGLGKAVAALGRGKDIRMGVVGLGVGTDAIYSDDITFYELNPEVEAIARDHFTYLTKCTKQYTVVLGDARLSLERQDAQYYDMLVLDAFSGDAIPTHLLTTEAFTTYFKHLREDGVIAVHISNNFLDLRPIIGGLAEHFGLQAAVLQGEGIGKEATTGNTWALLSKNTAWFDRLRTEHDLQPDDTTFKRKTLWTDAYSNIVSILKFK